MELTRRRFLECAAGAAAMAALPRTSRALERSLTSSGPGAACAIFDLGEECCIPESIAGYESALAQLGVHTVRIDARLAVRCATLIVPAARRISPVTGAIIRRSLDDGATVIVESGMAFADSDSAEFRAHRDTLREQLQLHVTPPISLWAKHRNADGIPYVDYSWPATARVRDFSRVVPVSSHDPRDAIIARVRGVPVALLRRTGSGTLVFLGSPLGPTLRAADAEARCWLEQVVAGARSGPHTAAGPRPSRVVT